MSLSPGEGCRGLAASSSDLGKCGIGSGACLEQRESRQAEERVQSTLGALVKPCKALVPAIDERFC